VEALETAFSLSEFAGSPAFVGSAAPGDCSK